MQQTLKKHYLSILLPGIIIFAISYLIYNTGGILSENTSTPRIISSIHVFLSAIFTFLAPMWLKITAVNKLNKSKKIEISEFIRFEKLFISISLISVYIFISAYLFKLSKIPMSVVIIFCLYSIYYYYPSNKRVNLEKRIFRIKDEDIRKD